ncbi:OLC1v1006416C1 [Oldenlandia corymbosa var. corymbosa]|uniref:OLC1v1006416C1 n=1 Tax=Oldenlandia corymbosa var. corymbosa TaxID=529605 RepID=A0AAV1DGX9_OLDCO|nr:OLC1v1006416C1 [Oldenlandia corymbosa var. corymbosa]
MASKRPTTQAVESSEQPSLAAIMAKLNEMNDDFVRFKAEDAKFKMELPQFIRDNLSDRFKASEARISVIERSKDQLHDTPSCEGKYANSHLFPSVSGIKFGKVAEISINYSPNFVQRTRVEDNGEYHNSGDNRNNKKWKPKPKLELPIFMGENARTWLRKCHKFFRIYEMNEEDMLDSVEFYMDGVADVWYQGFKFVNPNADWRYTPPVSKTSNVGGKVAAQGVKKPDKPFFKRLSPKEKEYKTIHNLYWKCNGAWGPGHVCRLEHVNLVVVDDDVELDQVNWLSDELESGSEIQVQAIYCWDQCITADEGEMKEPRKLIVVVGYINNELIKILIDTEVVRSFVDNLLAHKLGLLRKEVGTMDCSDNPLQTPAFPLAADGSSSLPGLWKEFAKKDYWITPLPSDGEDHFLKPEKGTTAMGCIFKNEWIMVAVDHSGTKQTRKFPENVIKLNSHLLVAFSGGSKALLKVLVEHLQQKVGKHELKEGREASAAEASKWLSDFLSLRPCDSLSLGIMIAGWDHISGPALYKVDGKGEVLKRDYVGTGSGSGSFVVFFLKPHTKMSEAETAELTKTALCIGVNNATESRKLVSVFQVGKAGVTRVVSNDDIKEWLKGHFRKAGYEWEDQRRFNKLLANRVN